MRLVDNYQEKFTTLDQDLLSSHSLNEYIHQDFSRSLAAKALFLCEPLPNLPVNELLHRGKAILIVIRDTFLRHHEGSFNSDDQSIDSSSARGSSFSSSSNILFLN